jgi:hypothetical protein
VGYTSRLTGDSLELPIRPVVQRGGFTDATASDFTVLTELLAECNRELGREHPETLALGSAIAYLLGEAGDPVGAAEAFHRTAHRSAPRPRAGPSRHTDHTSQPRIPPGRGR